MKESLLLRFLYRTPPGRALLSVLVRPGISRAAGRLLSAKLSGRVVPYYIKRHGIDMDGVEIPPGGFPSFNAFFTRKRREDAAWRPGRLLSPCDGFLTVLPIGAGAVFDIKHTRFSLEDLLRDASLAALFEGGTALLFRLTPANYHRYAYAADGRVCRSRRIAGKLHCVRPVALCETPVFVQNSREYQVIRTERFGLMVQMEVGALLVGRIRNRRIDPAAPAVWSGMEKGYFEFGGSTVILLLQKGAVRIRADLAQDTPGTETEIPIRKGEELAGSAARGI